MTKRINTKGYVRYYCPCCEFFEWRMAIAPRPICPMCREWMDEEE